MELREVLRRKKYFILDLDGTLYLGRDLFPFTREFLRVLRETGRKPIFLTNNSSKSTKEYGEKLQKMDIISRASHSDPATEIYTSGRAMIDFLLAKKMRRIFLMAPPKVQKEFEQAGISITSDHAKPALPQAVILAFDTTFTYEKFCTAYTLIMSGVPFFATHPDHLLPIENKKFLPDIGSLISAFVTATGKKPTIIGKPYKAIFEGLRRRLGCKKTEMVMIGDRLYTDIKGAHDFGITSILVLSGETTRAMLHKRVVKERRGGVQPDFVVKNVGGLVDLL